jgi:Tat protein secretion system quality control protein TatD with DNase activity
VLGPDRQARNEPANLVHSRHFIARAHGVSGEPVEEITDLNAAGLFPQVRRKAAGPV